MSDAGSGKEAKAWMALNGHQLPPPEPTNEKGARAGDLGGQRNRRTRDGRALAVAAELADAAHDILSHPSLTERERQIWGLHLQEVSWDRMAQIVGCSTSTVNNAIRRVKALMVSQAELAACAEPSEKPASPHVEMPDLEDSVALGALNAHRVIQSIHARKGESAEDVENNERAVRTVLAIRKSEWEYMQRLKPERGAPDDEVRRIAGSERV